MRIKSILILLICFLLSGLTIPAIACPPPPCPDCKTWNPVTKTCEWDCTTGQNCCGGSCCSNTCCNGTCCSAGQSCCGGSCCSGTCCDGICCSAGQDCCNGSCCDKVWTKETHTAIDESCPTVADCYEPGVGCDGVIVTDQQSYDSCLNVGVGSGEHCECNEEEQVVGYDYTCQEDWDWSMMASCAYEAALCFFQCLGAYADPASCADCLGMLELDCCGGDTCHICDFLESCDPLYPEEIKKSVFINFGDCS